MSKEEKGEVVEMFSDKEKVEAYEKQETQNRTHEVKMMVDTAFEQEDIVDMALVTITKDGDMHIFSSLTHVPDLCFILEQTKTKVMQNG